MNKKVLATVLLCFSLLLPAFPIVSAASLGELEERAKYEFLDITPYPTNTTLSREELLALPGYVTVKQESMKTLSDSALDPYRTDGGYVLSPVNTMIIVDDKAKAFLQMVYDDMHYNVVVTWNDAFNWAYSILEGGDDPFWSWYSLDYVACEYRAWVSPSGTLGDLLVWAQQTFPKPSGIDVTFILTGQGQPFLLGLGERPGDTFLVSALAVNYVVPLVNVWQHEASHNYGVYDHSTLDFTVCIMSGWYVAVTRSWCGGCSSTITANKYRFE